MQTVPKEEGWQDESKSPRRNLTDCDRHRDLCRNHSGFCRRGTSEFPAGSIYPLLESAGEAAGAGRKSREVETPPAVICGGCVSPTFATQGKGSIVPYGRIELDAIYSNRNTNPLDPGQFNGYATAAGKSSNASSTFNPRYSVFGLRADRTDGKHSLTGVVEADFYSQTDNAGNISPRLRLANVKYSPNSNRTTLTAGMDWTPIMSSHPNLIDFSIMGYNGNLWQRLPQITLKHQFTENFNGLLTVMRFERGLSAIQPQTQRRPFQGAGAGASRSGQLRRPADLPVPKTPSTIRCRCPMSGRDSATWELVNKRA